jgi:signal transduction histidine kinase
MDEAAERQRAFVADVVHDLQNPLTGIRTQLEVALAHARTDVAEAWVRSMLAATSEMELLVGDLLALAAEERRDRPAPRDVVDLDTLLHDEITRPRQASGVAIDAAGVEPLKVRGDETSLRRMVRNLLDNAVRHAESVVRLRLTEDEGTVLLDVLDDGPGVPEEHLDRIFDRFYRADPGRGGGTGLGLAIVQQVVERHDGRVAMVSSGPGEGAHFRVWLPIPD